jgi:hypothetical protein
MSEYDDLFPDDEPVKPTRSSGNGFVPPAAQTELGKNYTQFFVKAYKEGEKPFCEDYRDIDKAASRASYLHFKEEWGTRLIAVNTDTGIAAELRWKDKDTGYAVHSGK